MECFGWFINWFNINAFYQNKKTYLGKNPEFDVGAPNWPFGVKFVPNCDWPYWEGGWYWAFCCCCCCHWWLLCVGGAPPHGCEMLAELVAGADPPGYDEDPPNWVGWSNEEGLLLFPPALRALLLLGAPVWVWN